MKPGSDVLLKCPVFRQGVMVVWKNGGENGRVLSVGKMLVRADGKGENWRSKLSLLRKFLVRLMANSSLEVLELTEKDGGEYVCMVDTKTITLKYSHHVTVGGKQSICYANLKYNG